MKLIKKFRSIYLLQFCLISLLIPVCLLQVAAQEKSVQNTQVKILVADGVNLSTDIYLPAKQGKFPTILIRTPYGSRGMKLIGEDFASKNYAVVIQNIRGTSDSDGEFVPFSFDKDDGVATLEWIGKQKWSNQKVGFWGSSYLAYAGLQMASSENDYLKTGISISGWTEMESFIKEGDAFRLGDHLPWFIFSATGQNPPAEQMNQIFLTTPLEKFFGDQLDIEIKDDFDYAKVKSPILHITGWFDYIYRDTLRTYDKLQKHSQKKNSQKLLIGHWKHNEVYEKTTKAGDEDFGANAAMGIEKLLALSIEWFDFHLKGIANGVGKKPAVEYFVMGENRWHKSDKWTPENVDFQKWYLQKSENSFGRMSTKSSKEKTSTDFIFDPNNPVPTVGGVNSHMLPWLLGVKDQRFAEKRKDILIYDSAPLKKDTTLAGPIRAVIYASTEGKDTDFTAKLVEVRTDGYARIIESGIKRGTAIKSSNNSELLKAGEVYKFEIDLGATAIRLQKGSRIRVEVSSSNFPKYDRNPNTGEDPFKATAFKSVKQTIYHSPSYPSQIILPILREN